MTDKRKNYIFGISPGEWVMIGIIAFGGAMAYGASNEQIKQNTDKLEKHDEKHLKDIKDLREDLKNEVREINRKVDKIYEILIQQNGSH